MTSVGTPIYLDPRAQVLLLSDLHLGDGSRTDLFVGQDEALIDLIEHKRAEVQTIVFLGDILDLPQAWSVRRIRSAHPRLLAYLELLARDMHVIFVRGNHDWSVDYEALFPGARRCEAVLIGDRTLAWHGHQVDVAMNPGVRGAPFKTYVHAVLERMTGRRLLPPLELYDSSANRVAMAMTIAWAHASLARARRLHTSGRSESAGALETRVRYVARAFAGDAGDTFGATERLVLGNGFDTVVCGHSHCPGTVRTSRGTYVNTGTWTGGLQTYAQWTGTRFFVRDAATGKDLGDERFARLPEHTEPQDLFAWWADHHKGFLRFDLQ